MENAGDLCISCSSRIGWWAHNCECVSSHLVKILFVVIVALLLACLAVPNPEMAVTPSAADVPL
jgi:hypothetical protein